MSSRHPAFPRPETLAHRMLAVGYPENTLPSLRAAIELGCDWVEFDVWNTKDGALVSVHDSSLDRTTDGTGEVTALTLAEVRAFDAGAGFPHGVVRVPTVAEILVELRATNRPVRAEMHLHNIEAPEDLLAIVRDHALVERCYANMNTIATAMYVREDLEDVSARLSLNYVERDRQVLELCVAYDVAYLCVPPRLLTPEWVSAIHDAGLFVHCYPVQTPAEMRAMVRAGVDVIQTDDLEALQAVLRAEGFTL